MRPFAARSLAAAALMSSLARSALPAAVPPSQAALKLDDIDPNSSFVSGLNAIPLADHGDNTS
jgi:hypothetical protein